MWLAHLKTIAASGQCARKQHTSPPPARHKGNESTLRPLCRAARHLPPRMRAHTVFFASALFFPRKESHIARCGPCERCLSLPAHPRSPNVLHTRCSAVFFIARGLKKAGFDIDAVADGRSAIERLSQVSYDVVLTDIVMPTMGGIELAELLKDLHPAIKVAMMTGYPGGSPSEGRFIEGDYPVIPKPFKPSELRSMIAHIIDT